MKFLEFALSSRLNGTGEGHAANALERASALPSKRCLPPAWQPGWHLEGTRGTRLMKQPASGRSAGRPLFPSMICGLSKSQSFELPVRELAKREDPIDMVTEAISNQRGETEA
ncbi:hypothetical protein CPLU01_02284 [Colletotrichum plurivorum]|uniref:Uncharacterized protein n=1 Tax=Colletotrichum plurivorum TaxID=2175906 RepID=A0A8H6KXJ2_9PEZI|nr:hypothetical protein CPLU01_02284 [Colletotrichum plurivorum]